MKSRTERRQKMKTINHYDGISHTFVICAYQRSVYLEACIQSILRQSVRSSVCIATSTPNEHIRNMAVKYRLPLFINGAEEGKTVSENTDQEDSADQNARGNQGQSADQEAPGDQRHPADQKAPGDQRQPADQKAPGNQKQPADQKRPGKGIAADWNFACSCAATPLVTLAHQDDIYCRDYTKSILAALNRCRHPLIAFTDYCELRDGKTVRSNRLLNVKRLLLLPLRIEHFWGSRFVRRRILSLGSAICCPSVTLVRPNLPFPVFKNNMRSNIDWQAWAELSGLKGEFAYVPGIGMKHRIHGDSTTSDLLEKNERKQEDMMVYRMFWPEWAARILERFYQTAEHSNRTDGDQ